MATDKGWMMAEDADDEDYVTRENERGYWRANIRLLVTLMSIWFLVSFGAGILFRDFLDQWSLGGYPLGFWFAQQGAIYVFIALIVIYVRQMRKIEKRFGLDGE